MSPRAKACVYVLLAMLEPLGKQLAVGVEKAAWPSPFEWAATGCAMLYAGLLVLKAWSSDSDRPSIPPANPPSPTPPTA